MPAVYLHSHTVRNDEIDGQGHANNVVFVRWMQDAAIAHSTAQGWPNERYRATGVGWVARSHYIEYRLPAYAGETIIVHTWIADFQRVSSRRRYRMVRASDEALLAVAETNWAFISRDDYRLTRIPPEVRHAFEIVPDGKT